MQWDIMIVRWDINTALMTLSRFPTPHPISHLIRVKRMYGYLIKFCHLKIQFCIDDPNYDDVPIINNDWFNTSYGNVKEMLPDDSPKAKGKHVVLSTGMMLILCMMFLMKNLSLVVFKWVM